MHTSQCCCTVCIYYFALSSSLSLLKCSCDETRLHNLNHTPSFLCGGRPYSTHRARSTSGTSALLVPLRRVEDQLSGRRYGRTNRRRCRSAKSRRVFALRVGGSVKLSYLYASDPFRGVHPFNSHDATSPPSFPHPSPSASSPL